jgi:putative tryptophan/tyrosine transport system substrate-binding protein
MPRSISPASVAHRYLIVMLAVRHKLPAVYWTRMFVTAGGLVSYSNPAPA